MRYQTEYLRRLAVQITTAANKIQELSHRSNAVLLLSESACLSLAAEHCRVAAKSVDEYASKKRDKRGSKSRSKG